jgi:hypothetical protein
LRKSDKALIKDASGVCFSCDLFANFKADDTLHRRLFIIWETFRQPSIMSFGGQENFPSKTFVFTQNSNRGIYSPETVDSYPFQMILLPFWNVRTFT